jgi:DNA-binding NarL/FixJ family response regulator
MGAIIYVLGALAAKGPGLFAREDATQWVVLAVGAAATLYLLIRPRIKAKKDPLENRPVLSVSQQRQIERDMSNLMVEMLETARHMTAQLDTRAARLEVLIAQADQRLAALKSAVAEGVVPGVPESRETPPDPRHAEVWALADQGRAPHEIARQLNRPNGEVELILALRRH